MAKERKEKIKCIIVLCTLAFIFLMGEHGEGGKREGAHPHLPFSLTEGEED